MAPPTLPGVSNTDFARGLNATLVDYIAGVQDETIRNFQISALLEQAGRISYGHSGRGFNWAVQYKLHAMEGNTGETIRNFVRTNLWKRAQLPYRGYQATDMITNKELKENRGPQALIQLWNGFTDRLKKSLKQGLGPEFYIDGNATGNETAWHGFESFFGNGGTINISTGATRAANAADVVGSPSDTYAEIQTDLGTYGGAQESGSVWPLGVADVEYDFYSPLIINYTSTAFSPSTHTFAAQGDEALRYAILHSQRNQLDQGQPTNIILARDLFFSFKNLIDNKEQIQVMRNEPTGLVSLGFKNVINFDGVDVSWEAACPSAVGYGFNVADMELRCMDDEFLTVEGPEYRMEHQAYIAAVSTLSNLKFQSPRHFYKFQALA